MRLLRTRAAQSFRHRVYLPFVALANWCVDKALGVETQAIRSLEALGHNAGTRYETVSYLKLRQELQFARGLGFSTLVDIGCGKGRVLVVGRKVGFTKMIGVDISGEMLDICRANVEAELICADAADYTLPDCDCAIYMFNPFGEERMRSLVERIKKSPHRIAVVYHHPVHSDLFNDFRTVKRFHWQHGGLYDERCIAFLK